MTGFELGWVVGILEGEGHISVIRTRNWYGAEYKYLRIGCTSTDRDVLERLQAYTGVGNIRGPRRKKSLSHKLCYQWSVGQHDDVWGLLALIEPHLLGRRAKQARHVREVLV